MVVLIVNSAKKLSFLTSLRELTINVQDYPTEYFWQIYIAPLSQLETLNCPLIHYKHVAGLLKKQTNLTSLNLSMGDDEDIETQFYDYDERPEKDYERNGLCQCAQKDPKMRTIDLLKSIKRLTKLTSLDIKFRPLPFLASYLSSLTRLTSLRILGEDLEPCFPSHITTLTNLETLSIPILPLRYTAQQYDDLLKPFKKISTFYSKEIRFNESLANSGFIQQLTRLSSCYLYDAAITPLTNLIYVNIGIKIIVMIKDHFINYYLIVAVATEQLPYVATLTSLQQLILMVEPDPVDNLNELTTLTNLHFLNFYNADSKDFDRDWRVVYNYSKQMTNLRTIRMSNRYHPEENLPYSWQRIMSWKSL